MQRHDFEGSSFLTHFQPFQEIEGVKFTHREIDIIACLLQGRTQKTIAHFLSIAPRTVETHLRNIMLKLECNSREGIIDRIENAGQISSFRNHYQALLIHTEFEKQLQEIAQDLKGKDYACRLVYEKDKGDKIAFIQKLSEHLKKVGIKTSLEKVERSQSTMDSYLNQTMLEKQPILYVASKNSLTSFADLIQDSSKLKKVDTLLLLLWSQEDSLELLPTIEGSRYINLYENYYLSFFEILKVICYKTSIDPFIASFSLKKGLLHTNSTETEEGQTVAKQSYKELPFKDKTFIPDTKLYLLRNYLCQNAKTIVASVLAIITLVTFGIITSERLQKDEKVDSQRIAPIPQTIHSDLVIPKESAFLQRPWLIAEIDKVFGEQKGIRTIALVGIGGAGKTTLARQYARTQRASVVWEINAETKESLRNSFESLAYALARTEGEKKVLRELQEIKDAKVREEKFLHFVMEGLRLHQGWLLIYDNVEKFADVQKMFPYDPDAWGEGKIIVTTQDSNIINNNHIDHTIYIGELSPQEKLALFMKTMGSSDKNTPTSNEKRQAEKFLHSIPPFPLDISVAAHYLRMTNVTYEQYLEYLKENNKDFAEIQENVLKEASDYTKSRYRIITLSLKQLIEVHKDFAGLLLFISLLDSQNLPRDLLNAYKESVVVDNFLYHLKKYSLITHEIASSRSTSSFSIHRSTQEISLAYLTKTLQLKKDSPLLQIISHSLESYIERLIDKEDFTRMKLLVSHGVSFLSHADLLNDSLTNSIGRNLGRFYYHMGNYSKAKEILEPILINAERNYSENYETIAKASYYLGDVYRELGDHEKAKELFNTSLLVYKKHFPENYVKAMRVMAGLGNVYREQSQYKEAKNLYEKCLTVYEKYFPRNYIEITETLVYLAIIHTKQGNFKKAKNLLERSLQIYKRHFPPDHLEAAWTLYHFADVYAELGQYQEARKLYEQSLLIHKENLPEVHRRVAGVLAKLGNIYTDLGDYEKAKDLLEKSLLIYKKIFSEDHFRVIRNLKYLGRAYRGLGEYKTAKYCFEKCLSFYKEQNGDNHLNSAWIFIELGKVYLIESQLEDAENIFKQALNILQENHHPRAYQCFENLSEVYFKKALQAKDSESFQRFHNQAIQCLNHALEIVEASFPKDSPFKIKVQKKIQLFKSKHKNKL